MNLKKIVLMLIPILVADTKRPCRNSILTGKVYYEELIDEDCHPRRFAEVARMDQETFRELLKRLEEKGDPYHY